MDPYRAKTEVYFPITPSDRKRLESFLLERGLEGEKDVELMVAILYDGHIAASASLSGNIIKEVAVDPLWEGEGLAAAVVSRIISEAHDRGRNLLRVFTTPKNKTIFTALGFTLLAASDSTSAKDTPGVILLESDPRAFPRWVSEAKAELIRQAANGGTGAQKPYSLGSVVVNCNPFTLGHRSLIERAAAYCDTLLVFVLEADKSSFSSEARLRLVRQGTADLTNVAVIPSGPYLISEATFPTYFLKEKSRATEFHARLDINLFASRVAPALGIGARFMGTEPYCPVTNLYNSLMKELLPIHGLGAVELPRAEAEGRAISASRVREALRTGDWDTLKTLVPDTTLRYLKSPEAAATIEKIAAGKTRH